MEVELQNRHAESHYANIGYGYYTLLISVLYLVFLMLLRRLVTVNGRSSKIVKEIHSLGVLSHLSIVFLPLIIGFFLHNASKSTVYFKRLGRLSYVLLSLNLLLTLKPNWLLSSHYTYTDFVPIHKWFSRIIVLIALVHSMLFIWWWGVSTNPNVSIAIKLQKKSNTIGLAISILLITLMIVSIGPFRRFSYNSFYILHNISNLTLILLTPLHAKPGVGIPYFFINIILLLAIAFTRVYYVKRSELLSRKSVITFDRSTSLVNVRLPRSALPDNFLPACHIRISPYQRFHPLYWILPSHPYTVMSLPSDDSVDLVLLENIGKIPFRLHLERSYTIINQYNPSVPLSCLSNGKRICIVCGGTGISFGLPLYRYFSNIIKNNEREIESLRFIWLVKNKSQLELLDKLATIQDSLADERFLSNFHVFITKHSTIAPSNNSPPQDYELEELNRDDESTISELKFGSVNLGRRIEWATDLSTFVEHNNGEDETWMLACGPKSLIDSASKYSRKSGINFASELYAL